MRVFVFHIVFVLIFPIILFGQDKAMKYDSSYITDLSDSLAVRIYGINKFNGFSIRDNELGQEVDYSPNRNLNFGLGINYKWFGFGIAVNFPFLNNDNDKYGKTSRFDAQTHIFTRKLLIDFYGNFYNGFYIKNPNVYLPNWDNTMNYPQRQDVGVFSLGGSVLYILKHHKYSARAAFVQTEIQKKSAGSFLVGGFMTYFGATGDSAFIPYPLFDSVNPALRYKEYTVMNYGVAFGYSHTFVILKKFYASFTLVPGIAISNHNIIFDPPYDNRTGNVVSGRFLARMALGYNSVRSFAGFVASADSFSGKTGTDSNNQMNFEVGLFRFFYGRRINFPKIGIKK